MNVRKLWLPAGVLFLAGGVAAFTHLRPVEAPAFEVELGPVAREAAGTGTIESEAEVKAAFTIPGRVLAINVKEGDRVRVNDVLATLDGSEQEQQITLARRGIELASAAVKKSEAEIRRAKIALDAALRDKARIDALFARSAVAVAERDAVHERVERAESELAAAIAAERQSGGSVAVAHETVRLQSRRGDDTVLRSPLDGVVVKRLHEPGDVVAPGAVVLALASTNKIWASVWIDETALRELREGQPARVVLRGDATGSLKARVDRIAVEVDRQTHEVLVDLELLERPARVVFGQRADGFVELEARSSAPRVPISACDLKGGSCFVERDGRVALADVRFGLAGDEWIEVISGLGAGDVVLMPGRERRDLPLGRRVARSVQ